ncbi:uncharacterized protein LOC130745769 [Lotus japonicus]|uniref:uncharacterized protein LOC130745769 n=1 Tax=Lotus japonicus TaxID=34305 RepID=UPI00258E9A5F|nr:uncharacterized protein LOC130745769 [Lotus japonicus]
MRNRLEQAKRKFESLIKCAFRVSKWGFEIDIHREKKQCAEERENSGCIQQRRGRWRVSLIRFLNDCRFNKFRQMNTRSPLRPEDWDKAPDPKKYFVQFFGTEEMFAHIGLVFLNPGC